MTSSLFTYFIIIHSVFLPTSLIIQFLHADDESDVKGEYLIWQQLWSNCAEDDRPRNALAAYQQANAVSFPNIRILLQILCTFGCTTAEPERVFSTLKRSLTWLRTTMCEERLEGLILLSSHRDLCLSVDTVLNKFAENAHRLQLIL